MSGYPGCRQTEETVVLRGLLWSGAHRTGREPVTSHVHSIDGEIQTWQMYYKYSSFHIWIFMTKQETISTLNHVNGQRAR